MKIYLLIGMIEFLLVYTQIMVIKNRIEKKHNCKIRTKNTSLLENWLAIVKSAIVFMIPIFRTILTLLALFDPEIQEGIANDYENTETYEWIYEKKEN